VDGEGVVWVVGEERRLYMGGGGRGTNKLQKHDIK